MPKQSIRDYLQRKDVRFALAALCTYFALQGVGLLIAGESHADAMRGGGGVLLWGGWAVTNALKPYRRNLPGLNVAINIGLVLIVASWVMPN